MGDRRAIGFAPIAARGLLAAALIWGAIRPAIAAEIASPNEFAGGHFGYAIDGLADLNGDGFGELLIGAPRERIFQAADYGSVYVIDGRGGATLAQIDPPPGSPSGIPRFGEAVCAVPDVDGDGKPEFAIGAHYESLTTGSVEGRVHLYSGALPPTHLRAVESPNSLEGVRFGASIGGVPDADGDGKGDFVAGASEENFSGFDACGRAYLYSGATGAVIASFNSIAPEEFISTTDQASRFGAAVAGIDDLDGDGRGDVIVGAYGEDFPAGVFDSGRAYIFSGATGAPIRTHTSPNADAIGYFGYSVSGIPDIDGDGRGDYAIGAPGDDPASPFRSGRVYLYSGATGALVRTLRSINEESITGSQYSGQFGLICKGVADLTGDGRGDVIVGAPYENPAGRPEDSGMAYVFSGAEGALFATLGSPVPMGTPAELGFGFGLAGAPDFTGDGIADIAIGASNETTNALFAESGRVYTFKGGTGEYFGTNAAEGWGEYE